MTGFDKSDLLLAIDGAIANLLTVKRIIEKSDVEGLPEKLNPCPISDDGEHARVLWEHDGTGMCRDCGAELTRDGVVDPGVSGNLGGDAQP